MLLNRPEIIAKINDRTVPVMVNATDTGFPQGIPALAKWAAAYRTNPFIHMTFSHFVLMDAAGEKVYGVSSCQFAELVGPGVYHGSADDLKAYVDRYWTMKSLRERVESGEHSAAEELARREKELAQHIDWRTQCTQDQRLITARYLLDWGASKWTNIMGVLLSSKPGTPKGYGPGVREAVVHALGEILVDDSPFRPLAKTHLDLIYSQLLPGEREQIHAGIIASGTVKRVEGIATKMLPVPNSLRFKAAWSLRQLTGQKWKYDRTLIASARDWWTQHQSDPAWAIGW